MIKFSFVNLIQPLIVGLTLLPIAASNANADEPSKNIPWQSIFNGENLDGWNVKLAKRQLDNNYGDTFRVVDGKLVVSYDQYKKFDADFGHIFYHQPLSYYNLRVTYRFVGEQLTGGPVWAIRNTGIMFHAQNPSTMSIEQSFPVSIEAQILGGNGMDKRTTGNVCTPGTHLLTANKLVTEHCINSKSTTYHGDNWVTMEIRVRGAESVEHYVNNELVMRYTQPQYDFSDKDTKHLKPQHKDLAFGYIALQAESHGVEFKDIELQNLAK